MKIEIEIPDLEEIYYTCYEGESVNGKDLKTVVLADAIVEGNAEGFKKELDVNGAACTVIINKVAK